MVKSEKSPQSSFPSHTPSLHESDEGGLNLGQFGSVLRRRSLLIIGVTGAVAGGAVLKAQTEPLVYQGKLEILTKSVTAERQVTANIPQSVNIAPPESEQDTKTTIKVLQSSSVLSSVIKTLKPKYPDLDYGSLLNDLDISSTEKEKNIIQVVYSSKKETQAQDVMNVLAKTYLNYSLKERRADVEEAIEFVQARINEKDGLRSQVRSWQDKLATFRRINNLVEPEKRAAEVSTYITTLTQQQLENRVQLEQMVAQYQDLQKELAQQPTERAGNSLLSANARYQKILDTIQEVDIETKKSSALFTDAVPTIETLKDKKANLLPMLKAEEQRVLRDFQSRIYELEARDKSIKQKINTLNAYLKQLATLSRDYDRIQQELKISSENLNQFLAKRQALQIELSQKQQPWQLLNPPENASKGIAISPLDPKIKLYLGLGGMLGLLLGTGAALLTDKLRNVYYTAKDLKDTTTLPLLGVIPFRKELVTPTKEDQPLNRSLFFEVFRSLYTNILLLGSDSPIRSLVIGSATQGEGKSTVAIQLAQAAAAMGQRVLLVDADLRFPTLHKLVGSMNIQGLTDVISHNLDWENVIEKSRQEENLYIISAGQVPPDPIRLLASQKMQDLMNELQTSFDLVIYDTPNLLSVADANLLAAHTNGMILVTELGKLKRTAFQQALEELQIAGTPMLGMVANKSKEDTSATSNYYRQYYKKQMSVETVEMNAQIISK
ncbi:polysaccharide biosynthesis tyrosine autokinase [Calothrix sp. PCC 7507]|uniref:polysaccharide biosynthesis tyrosine autokinase n=1 Tax=Calothrix sp. PCC 7507 TaxID=99598 RepID=UPI00029EDF39|nr:polysaccharide biosynthesis tyrosine autokinase [Calothrix sp. PCC 7507]AFY36231.1 capsular exopolysaccharide family [Calothrix sp. PCC 7507]